MEKYQKGQFQKVQYFAKAQLKMPEIIITVVFYILILCVIILVFFEPTSVNDVGFSNGLKNILLIILLVILIILPMIRPSKYYVTNNELIIKSILYKIKIPMDQIVYADSISRSDLCINLRVFGSGGVWGHFGIFYSSIFGKLKMYASNYDYLIMVKTRNNIKYVISPDNRKEFIKYLLIK